MEPQIESDSDDFQILQPQRKQESKSSFFEGLCQGSKLSQKQKKLRQKVRQQSQQNVNQTSLKEKIQRNKNSHHQKVSFEDEGNFAQERVLVDGSLKSTKKQVAKPVQKEKSFQQLRIIRPLLKAISDVGYTKPTPIQQQAIPVIMSGKDTVASSITGSGKTAAFVLPIIQRYFHAAAVGYIRALIVTPTRELAIQIHEQFEKLNKYTKLESCLVIGGSSVQRQQQILRNNPEVVITTPGRIIDLLMNSRSVGIENLEMIVFDEADKLLQLGFQAQIKQIMSHTHQQVQSILFSATISKQINKLATITSKKPIRVSADPDHKTAQRLHQQVIKLKQQTDEYREAVLISILTQLYKEKVIVFFKTKKECHRIAIILGLLGLQACELHGNLSQTQRIQAFLDFKQGKYEYMLATDLAARGLDIKQVKTVVNFQLPIQLTRYIHRIGRTARAGCIGTSVTLCSDYECLQLKKMSKKTGDKLFKLNVRDQSVKKMAQEIRSLEHQIENVVLDQRQERQLRKAQMQLKRAQNINEHQDQIMSRPKREWFMSQKQKKNIQEKAMKQMGLQPLNNNAFEKNRSNGFNRNKKDGFNDRNNKNKNQSSRGPINRNNREDNQEKSGFKNKGRGQSKGRGRGQSKGRGGHQNKGRGGHQNKGRGGFKNKSRGGFQNKTKMIHKNKR